MPNLRMVALASFWTRSKALAWILGELQNPQPGIADTPELVANYLDQLEEVHWLLMPDSSKFSMEPLLLLPNIKRLFITPCEPSFTINNSRVPDFQSRLQSLRIYHSMPMSAFLQHNLSRCKALQNLDLDLAGCYDIKDTNRVVDLGDFGCVIRNFGQDLVSLKLRFQDDEKYARREIGSLKGLESLRHLSVPKFVLVGTGKDAISLTEALPGSLETLEMELRRHFCPPDSDTTAEESAANDYEVVRLFHNNQFPHLQKVMYECYMRGQVDGITNFTKVKGWSVENTGEPPRFMKMRLVRVHGD